CTIESKTVWSFAATWSLLVIGVSLATALVRHRAEELDLDAAFRQTFLLATLAIGGEMRRLAVDVERRVVRVLLVEHEDVGILGGSVGTIDETPRLRALHLRDLLLQQPGQRIALALGRPDLRHHRAHV